MTVARELRAIETSKPKFKVETEAYKAVTTGDFEDVWDTQPQPHRAPKLKSIINNYHIKV